MADPDEPWASPDAPYLVVVPPIVLPQLFNRVIYDCGEHGWAGSAFESLSRWALEYSANTEMASLFPADRQDAFRTAAGHLAEVLKDVRAWLRSPEAKRHWGTAHEQIRTEIGHQTLAQQPTDAYLDLKLALIHNCPKAAALCESCEDVGSLSGLMDQRYQTTAELGRKLSLLVQWTLVRAQREMMPVRCLADKARALLPHIPDDNLRLKWDEILSDVVGWREGTASAGDLEQRMVGALLKVAEALRKTPPTDWLRIPAPERIGVSISLHEGFLKATTNIKSWFASGDLGKSADANQRTAWLKEMVRLGYLEQQGEKAARRYRRK